MVNLGARAGYLLRFGYENGVGGGTVFIGFNNLKLCTVILSDLPSELVTLVGH